MLLCRSSWTRGLAEGGHAWVRIVQGQAGQGPREQVPGSGQESKATHEAKVTKFQTGNISLQPSDLGKPSGGLRGAGFKGPGT